MTSGIGYIEDRSDPNKIQFWEPEDPPEDKPESFSKIFSCLYGASNSLAGRVSAEAPKNNFIYVIAAVASFILGIGLIAGGLFGDNYTILGAGCLITTTSVIPLLCHGSTGNINA